MAYTKRVGFVRETAEDTDVNVTNSTAIPVEQSDVSLISQKVTISLLQHLLEQQKLTNELLKGMLQ